MKFAVRYYTQTGNTKRLAEAIAEEIGVDAMPITTPIDETRIMLSRSLGK